MPARPRTVKLRAWPRLCDLPLPVRSHCVQDMVLFNDSIYYNIAYGDLDAPREKVRGYCKLFACFL